MQQKPSVLILGARGRFGSAAVRAFAGAGWDVVAQQRPAAGRERPDAAARWIECDASDTQALVRAAPGAQVVVHAMNPAYTDAAWTSEAPGLMASAIEVALALGALLMFPGNVYNFGAAMPRRLSEATPQAPTTVKGAVRVALEEALRDAGSERGLRSVVIRAGDFFGLGPGTLLDMVIAKDLRKGRLGLAGGEATRTPFAYLPDLAATFVRVAERRDAVEGATVLHFRGHELVSADWREALTPLARERGWIADGQALRPAGIPWWLIRAGGLVHPVWRSLAQTRYVWTTPHGLDNDRLVDFIGPEPHTPLPVAVRASLEGT